MPCKTDCERMQCICHLMISVFGIRHINKKGHQQVRDLTMKRIGHILDEYKVCCEIYDEGEQKRKQAAQEVEQSKTPGNDTH